MILLLGQNAGLLSNALEVGKRLFVDDRWPAAPCLHPDVSSGSKTEVTGLARHVRFTLRSRYRQPAPACPFGVESRCDAVALGSNISVAAPFVRRCLNGSNKGPSSHPPHPTSQAEFSRSQTLAC